LIRHEARESIASRRLIFQSFCTNHIPVGELRVTETELQTRRRRIDTALVGAGWQVTPLKPGIDLSRLHAQAVPEFETANGPADYALFADGLLVGEVEAKRLSVGPQQALTQAERYSRDARGTPFDFHGFHIPFLYATNGEVIHFHDVREPHHRSRRLSKFHTPSALRELLARSTSAPRDWFEAHPNQHPWLRPYQKTTNSAVEAGLAAGRREMLVAMATGTGKTVSTVNQIYRLLKSGAAKRVLFLVDRLSTRVEFWIRHVVRT
jgi:type I restriction enzyme R subunit